MKQIVDFEQAKRLYVAKIGMKTELVIAIGAREIAQPAIGELIEWICEHRQIKGTRQLFEVSEYLNKMGIWRGELIDALVDLCCKIKESE
jgi:hypothetical protein